MSREERKVLVVDDEEIVNNLLLWTLTEAGYNVVTARPMAKNELFLPTMVQMVRAGEETSNLSITLLAVAQSYEAKAKDKKHSLVIAITLFSTIY